MDVGAQVVGRIGNMVLGVVATVVLVRALGDADYGRWSTALILSQLAVQFGEVGLEQTAVRRAAAEPDKEAALVGTIFILRLVLAVPAIAIGVVVAILVADNTTNP